MKKIMYTISLLFVLSLAISSCTEDNVKPQDTTGGNVGGGMSDPYK